MEGGTVLRVLFTVAVAVSLWAPGARADLFADFDALSPGQISGQDGWAGGASARVIREYSHGGNQLLRLAGDNVELYRDLSALQVPNGQTATLFFRFMSATSAANHGIGLSDVSAPDEWGDYESTSLVYTDGSSVKVRGRKGRSYVDLTLNGGANGLAPGTWYDVWMVVDNAADVTDFYLQGGDVATQRKVGDNLGFRNGTASNPMRTFFLNVGSGGNVVLVDDVHVSAGEVLGTPSARPERQLDLDGLADVVAEKLTGVHNRIATNAYPSVTNGSGVWSTTSAGSWTSGFYPGQLWQMYGRTGEEVWRTRAEARTAGLESQKNNDGTHDIGFMIYNSFGRGYQLTGNTAYRDVCLTAADTLATRFSPVVGAIQSWGNKSTGDYEVIIDNMMNLELLFWAAAESGDTGLYDIAVTHALTTRDQHVRPDGSTYHVVEFDRSTGDVIDKYTHQGYDDESTWTRGQAWGTYGFTLTYRLTGDARFLETAVSLADYFLDNLPDDFVPPNDFDAPGSVPKDSSAAAITAAALLELMDYVDEANAERYFDAAEEILLSLAGPAYLTADTNWESLLQEGSVKYNGISHIGTSYGDYYFLEALTRYEAIPEPATLALLAVGGLAVAIRRRRR